jgi:hypothetical protein
MEQIMNAPNSELQRAAEAHRSAFALVTAALLNPEGFDPQEMLAEFGSESNDPAQCVLDISAALVWHVAGAVVRATGDREGALDLIRAAALLQEEALNG